MTLSSRARRIVVFLIAGGIGFLIEAISIHIGVSILGSDPQSPRFFLSCCLGVDMVCKSYLWLSDERRQISRIFPLCAK